MTLHKTKLTLTLALFLAELAILSAQIPASMPQEGLQGYWSFNGDARDAGSHEHHGVVSGPTLTRDRFGNENFAYHFNGISDLISTNYPGVLGSHPRAVSFWLKTSSDKRGMPIIVWGHNGIRKTKGTRFNCGMNYKSSGPSIDIADAAMTYDAHSKINDGEWHHYVFQFTAPILKRVEIYQDGFLIAHEGTVFYPYTRINTLHSFNVHFGALIHQPDNFYYEGDLDDIVIYNRALAPSEILQLYNAPDPRPDFNKVLIYWIIAIIGLGVFIMLLRYYIKLRIRLGLRKEMEKNYFLNNRYEQENKVLKAQMDPHFIFNSLNTIQQFILTNENEKAQLYLYKFSRLMRQMIESNVKDSISLEDELELLEKYLEIETLRFDNVFNYEIQIPEGKELSELYVPHFLIQPFIENAIWHGLLPKNGDKQLSIKFTLPDDKKLCCTIEDNGVGRKTPTQKADPKKKRSLAINFIRQRLELMSKIRKTNYELNIEDRINDSGMIEGTRVTITMPIM